MNAFLLDRNSVWDRKSINGIVDMSHSHRMSITIARREFSKQRRRIIVLCAEVDITLSCSHTSIANTLISHSGAMHIPECVFTYVVQNESCHNVNSIKYS